MFTFGAFIMLLTKLGIAGGTSTLLGFGSYWFNKKNFTSKKAGVSHVDIEHEIERRIR